MKQKSSKLAQFKQWILLREKKIIFLFLKEQCRYFTRKLINN